MFNHAIRAITMLACITATAARAADLHGFTEVRYGTRTQTDPVQDDTTLSEWRLQLETSWFGDLLTAEFKTDLLLDDEADDSDSIDLEAGDGPIDIRLANLFFAPLDWMDIKVGRQVLTWGTGDLLFINDLFPKDWQSFFLGRDQAYLKAPSDALSISLFPTWANVNVAYTPRFDADRHITGEHISYWNGSATVGEDAILQTDQPDDPFTDDELAIRAYRSVGANEVAIYGYDGFWKSPGGIDPATGKGIFPRLTVYGGSIRGPLGDGIANAEAGIYDSRDDGDGTNPFVNNSELRLLAGYEQEAARNLTLGVQYYLEHMLDHGRYEDALAGIGADLATARDEDRHTVTLRVTYLAMNQNLVLSCFTRYSPSDEDVYIKPSATYKLTDNWQAAIGGNVFAGQAPHTFLGQFENNSNIHGSMRYTF